MLKVYGSPMCPDCRELKANFDYYQIPYEFVDINLSLHNLAEFLSLRDSLAVFDRCKQIGDIGLPATVDTDGTVFLDWEGYLARLGKEVVYREERKAACSLDGKGC